jgi:hypothetical protein
MYVNINFIPKFFNICKDFIIYNKLLLIQIKFTFNFLIIKID